MTATQFPHGYRGGAFIAFHGSWNRAPAPQGGYNVVFQPLADGKAAGPFVVFADGFAGACKEPGRAAYRPDRPRSRAGRLALCRRRHGRTHLAYHLRRQPRRCDGVSAAPVVQAETASGDVLPPEGDPSERWQRPR